MCGFEASFINTQCFLTRTMAGKHVTSRAGRLYANRPFSVNEEQPVANLLETATLSLSAEYARPMGVNAVAVTERLQI